jgi:predicted kinase
MLVIFRGLPGTGKSFLVRKLVERRPEVLVLSRDALRESVVAHPDYGEEEKALIDDLIVRAAAFLLSRGRSVVIDGMALSSAARVRQFVEAAAEAEAAWRIVECRASEAAALSRLAADRGRHPAGDRGFELYYAVKARFQALPWPCLAVDGEADPAGNVDRIIAYMDGPA